VAWQVQKRDAWTTLPCEMDEEALTQIRMVASRQLVLGNELFRREID
jgi:hypothetical protein